MNNLSDELENRKTQLNDTCRIVLYNQVGVEQLLYQREFAKKLLIEINDKYPECRNNQNLLFQIRNLTAINTTLKKLQEIQEHMDTNGGSQEA